MSQKIVVNGVEIPVPQPPTSAHNCSIDELKSYLEQQELYEQRIADATAGNPRTDDLYAMPMEELQYRAEQQYAAAEAKRIDDEQGRAALTFVANEPTYIKTPENAQILFEEIQRRGLGGSVYDIKNVFDELVASGRMQAKFIPPVIELNPTRERLNQMPMEELKKIVDEQNRRPDTYDERFYTGRK